MNFAKFLVTPLLKNTCKCLLLTKAMRLYKTKTMSLYFFLKSINFVHYQNHPSIKTPSLFRVDTTSILFSQAAIDFCDSTCEEKQLKENLLCVGIFQWLE